MSKTLDSKDICGWFCLFASFFWLLFGYRHIFWFAFNQNTNVNNSLYNLHKSNGIKYLNLFGDFCCWFLSHFSIIEKHLLVKSIDYWVEHSKHLVTAVLLQSNLEFFCINLLLCYLIFFCHVLFLIIKS